MKTKTKSAKSARSKTRKAVKSTRKSVKKPKSRILRLLKNHKGFIPIKNKSKKQAKKIKFGSKSSRTSRLAVLGFVLVFGAVGAYMLFFSSAQTPPKTKTFNGKIAHAGIRFINPDGTGAKQIHYSGANYEADWSWDGKQIAFKRGNWSKGDIYTMRSDGTGEKQITNTPDTHEKLPRFSPDSKYLAYWEAGKDVSSPDKLVLRDLSTGNVTDIHEESFGVFDMDWHPDGKQIIFVSGEKTAILNTETSAVKTLEKKNPEDPTISDVEYSHDGSQIYYRRSNNNIYVMNSDGTNQKAITTHGKASLNIALSPDNKYIAYTYGNPFELHVMKVDGTGDKKIAAGGSYPAWQPRVLKSNSVHSDFNGDGYSDIFLYAPGTEKDVVWYGTPESASFRKNSGSSVQISGTYKPVSGDFNGDGYSDIFYYGPGSTADTLWYGGPKDGEFRRDKNISVSGSKYLPIPGLVE